MIYVSIFREKAHEYKKILDLKASDKVRDTFYSEILDIIAAYESGLADAVKNEYESLGHPLSIAETEALFRRFESMALWKPLIHRGRTKWRAVIWLCEMLFIINCPNIFNRLIRMNTRSFLVLRAMN